MFSLNLLGWHWLIRFIGFRCTFLWYIICTLHCGSTTKYKVCQIFRRHIFDPLYPLPFHSPSFPLATAILLSMNFCLPSLFICCFQSYIPRMGEIIWFLTFSVWLISLSMIPSRSIRVLINGSISPFLMADSVPLRVCVSSSYPIIYFRALQQRLCVATVNNASMNIGVHMFLWMNAFNVFVCRYLEKGLLDHMVTLFWIFWGAFMLFPRVAAPVYAPPSSEWGSTHTFSWLRSLHFNLITFTPFVIQ